MNVGRSLTTFWRTLLAEDAEPQPRAKTVEQWRQSQNSKENEEPEST